MRLANIEDFILQAKLFIAEDYTPLTSGLEIAQANRGRIRDRGHQLCPPVIPEFTKVIYD